MWRPTPPYTLPALVGKVVVTHHLLVVVVDLVAAVMKIGMVDIRGCTSEEKAVMVDIRRATVQMYESEDINVLTLSCMQDV
jgi:hypothetical protein